jgi:hypothetical protein
MCVQKVVMGNRISWQHKTAVEGVRCGYVNSFSCSNFDNDADNRENFMLKFQQVLF